MKKWLTVMGTVCLALSLLAVPWHGSQTTNADIPEDNKDYNEWPQQKFIMQDSVDDPLPPEAENVQTMPDKGGPQDVPNFDYSSPIIITKMQYSENNNH